jgi:leader peptidase (prepilin peptidase)/N-methyltransferase
MSIATQLRSSAPVAIKYKLASVFCAAVAAALSVYVAPDLSGLCGALLAILMTAIAYRDAQDFIIPDQYSAAAFVLALVAAWFAAEQDAIWALAAALARAAVLALAFLAIRLLYHRLRARHGLGLGDVKLAGVAGAWLDWTMLPVAVEIAALAALTGVLAHQLITRQDLKTTTRLPFGLFLAPAIWIGWLLQSALPWP